MVRILWNEVHFALLLRRTFVLLPYESVVEAVFKVRGAGVPTSVFSHPPHLNLMCSPSTSKLSPLASVARTRRI